MRSFLLLVATTASLASAFAPKHNVALRPIQSASSSRLHEFVGLDPGPIDEARTAFFFWLFGASGGAGIARSSFPRMFKNVMEVNSLKGIGPSEGGETLDMSPLCAYPEAIFRKDVEQIVNNKLSVEQIVQKYPIEGNFLSAKGYLTYAAFKLANPDANPLSLRAVFDSLNTSADVSNPEIAQELFNTYKTDPDALAGKVLLAKMKGYGAIFFLLFLLALADYEAFAVHFRLGTFVVCCIVLE
jgi:hypothetical protein